MITAPLATTINTNAKIIVVSPASGLFTEAAFTAITTSFVVVSAKVNVTVCSPTLKVSRYFASKDTT